MVKKQFYVVVYDVRDDKRRTKGVKSTTEIRKKN